MTKRIIIAIAVATLLLSILLVPGCKKAEPVTLQLLTMKQAAYSDTHINEMVAKFMEANPEITVQVTFVPYESLHDKIVTDQASGSGMYDVVLVDEIWPVEFAATNYIVPINDRITSEMRAGVSQALLDILKVGDNCYGLPWILDTKFLFYNKDMLAEAGYDNPPATWDELVAQARAIKQKGICKYPIAWSWAQAEALICDYAQLVYSFGGEILALDGTAKVNTDGALDALNFMRQTISDGITNPNSTTYLEEDVRKILSEGKAAFTLNWTYVFAMANDPATSQVPGQIGIAPTPAGPAGPVGVSGSMGLSVTGSSTHPDQAWKLIDFLCSEANQKQYASDSLPIWTAALDAADLNASPELVAAGKIQFAAVKGRPEFVSWYNAFSTKLQVAIQKVLLGTQSAQEAMDPMLAEAEQLKSGQ